MKHYIVSDPKILSGKPVIVGTRIPIARVLFLLKEGFTIKDIHQEYPNVNTKTIKGVIDELTQVVDSRNYGSQLI